MKMRRCVAMLIEPRDTLEFDLDNLLSGGDGASRAFEWIALVPALGREVEVSASEVALLAQVSCEVWTEPSGVATLSPELDALRHKGLIYADLPEDDEMRERDERVRSLHWHSASAAAHYFTRWQGIDADPDAAPPGYDSLPALMQKLGPPPAALVARGDADRAVNLARATRGSFDDLLERRATCRNFAADGVVTGAQLGSVLDRVFGARAVHTTAEGGQLLKKNHPSGGALHPIEAYVVARRVEGLAAGLYHYSVERHALDPLPPSPDLDGFARACVGGQRYFAEAPVLVIQVVRFARTYWKYRRHAKAYRAVLLEAGHASQNLFLSATDLGLGAFITAAINEIDVEHALGLDTATEGVLAVNGFGPRASSRATVEFDPLHRVWCREDP